MPQRSGPGAHGGQAGQNLILIALSMTVFLGFVGLALDGGAAYLQQLGLQRAAEMAALSAASSYYRSNYAGNNAHFPHAVDTPAGGVATARAAADAVIAANGFSPSVRVGATELLDFQGNRLPAQCDPTCPGPTDVRGFGVTLSSTLPTNFIRILGFNQATLGASARASITTPGGAAREAPLLLQNFTDATFKLRRNNVYGTSPGTCAETPGDGVQYSPPPDDCRPGVGTGAAPLALVPADETAPPSLPGFANQTKFYLLHRSPQTCKTDGTCNATATTVSDGELDVILTCPPAPCSTPQYFAALDHSAGDGVVAGMNTRISKASGPDWVGQDCSLPLGGPGVPPLTPDNPRLMRLPINYGLPLVPLTGNPNVGQARVSETVMFCVQYTMPTTPVPVVNDYAVPGYLVNTSDLSATTTATPGAYFGQDVLIRLIP